MKSLLVIMALALSSPAFAADCFSTFNLRGWKAINTDTLHVEAGRKTYELEVLSCTELPWAHRIAFDSFGSRVCRGDKVLVLDNFSNRVRQSCWIQKITEL